jgi:hypothetical protein
MGFYVCLLTVLIERFVNTETVERHVRNLYAKLTRSVS